MVTELSHGWSSHLFLVYLLTRNIDDSGGNSRLLSVYDSLHLEKRGVKYRSNLPNENRYCILLTFPYFACHAKKYSKAANGCPISTKLTQNIQFPITFPVIPSIFARGAVIDISGTWITIPTKATPSILCVGTPTASSCKRPEKMNTIAPAA